MTLLRIALVLATVLSLGVAIVNADDNVETEDIADEISSFWGSAISQWESWIVYWAQERELDPDLVAAVIRKESIGRASEEGPYGSVGLMMVMPAEISGMPWRPDAEELKQPGVNIRWGTGILKQIIRDSGGDVKRTLAAYNGGWGKVYLTSTERYAHSVLNYYAYAIAARHGYSYQESKVWSMVIVTRVDGRITLIQTDSSGHFLAPCFEGALEFREIYPEMVSAPRTQVAHFIDEDGHDVVIDAWLFVGGLDRNVGEMLVGTTPPALPFIGYCP